MSNCEAAYILAAMDDRKEYTISNRIQTFIRLTIHLIVERPVHNLVILYTVHLINLHINDTHSHVLNSSHL